MKSYFTPDMELLESMIPDVIRTSSLELSDLPGYGDYDEF